MKNRIIKPKFCIRDTNTSTTQRRLPASTPKLPCPIGSQVQCCVTAHQHLPSGGSNEPNTYSPDPCYKQETPPESGANAKSLAAWSGCARLAGRINYAAFALSSYIHASARLTCQPNRYNLFNIAESGDVMRYHPSRLFK